MNRATRFKGWLVVLAMLSLFVLTECVGEKDNLLDPHDLLFGPDDTLTEPQDTTVVPQDTTVIPQDTIPDPQDIWVNIPLQDSIENVQPMTGIVYWNTSGHNTSEAIALEFSYMLFNAVVEDSGVYDWGPVEAKLNAIATRGHQAIFRFRFVYPGYHTSVPDYIKDMDDYNETIGLSEGRTTHFPDWTHDELKRFTLEFQQRFAEEYDNDPRLAFIQVGFGLWAEYHIYDGPFVLGETFPSKAFQADFFHHMDAVWLNVPWSISIDAADATYSPFSQQTALLDIPFGVFDDSFMHANHSSWNLGNWNFFDRERYRHAPAGGEFNYYTSYDQQNVLNPGTGAHGTSYEQWAEDFHITYMLGNDQPGYQTEARIKEASMASGYQFEITSFQAKSDSSRLTIMNTGPAPFYYDAFVTINGIRSNTSLKHLSPVETIQVEVASGGSNPVLTIESDRLLPGQIIEYRAFLGE